MSFFNANIIFVHFLDFYGIWEFDNIVYLKIIGKIFKEELIVSQIYIYLSNKFNYIAY